MISSSPQDVTAAVLAELQRAPTGRWRDLMTAAVTHLHGFERDTGPTETRFQQACAGMARMGQLTTATPNEVVPTAGSRGVLALARRTSTS